MVNRVSGPGAGSDWQGSASLLGLSRPQLSEVGWRGRCIPMGGRSSGSAGPCDSFANRECVLETRIYGVRAWRSRHNLAKAVSLCTELSAVCDANQSGPSRNRLALGKSERQGFHMFGAIMEE